MSVINPVVGQYEHQAFVNEVKRAKRSTEATKTNIAESSGEPKKDKVSLSGALKDMQIAKEAVASLPELRNDKVNTIKRQVSEGTYTVKPEKIAENLVRTNIDTLT